MEENKKEKEEDPKIMARTRTLDIFDDWKDRV